MRKRRRLADKLTIMVCAVLVAVSAFFYAPMDVSAKDNISFSVTDSGVMQTSSVEEFSDIIGSDSFSHDSNVGGLTPIYFRIANEPIGSFDLSNYFDLLDNTYYSVDVDFTYNVTTDKSVYFFPGTHNLYMGDFNYLLTNIPESNPAGTSFSRHSTRTIVFNSSSTIGTIEAVLCYYSLSQTGSINLNDTVNISFSNLQVLSSSSSDDFQNGYNAGYSAGEQAGYGNGYSQGFSDGEASVDTNEIYNQGFNAGKESVDTQSYYDAGYQAGYQVAYQEGFDSGYDEGYQSAMDRIDGWGADTADYPLLLLDKPLMSRVFDVTVKSSIPTRYSDFGEWTTDLIFNPNHTYRFNVVLNPTEYKEGSADIYFLNEDIFYLNVGGIKYRISNFSTAYVNTFFVPGDRMSTAFGFSWEPLLAVMGDTFESGSAYCYYDLNYQIYDMGPSGDTQNHIANQTDSLTNGFNDSHGNSVNNDFSSGLNDFETAEDSLFATATTGMKDFTFFDISSVPAMVTGMSFVGSIMSGWFTQAGGASGVGIVLSILFSIILVAMVLGLYRWYQSKGGKD